MYFIAQSRDSKDSKGVNLIDGPGVKGTLRPRQGIAEIYIERPGYEAAKRVSKKKKFTMLELTFLTTQEETKEEYKWQDYLENTCVMFQVQTLLISY